MDYSVLNAPRKQKKQQQLHEDKTEKGQQQEPKPAPYGPLPELLSEELDEQAEYLLSALANDERGSLAAMREHLRARTITEEDLTGEHAYFKGYISRSLILKIRALNPKAVF